MGAYDPFTTSPYRDIPGNPPSTDYTDLEMGMGQEVTTPAVFIVTPAADGQHNSITVGGGSSSAGGPRRGRRLVSFHYRVYFVPLSVLSSTDATDPNKVANCLGGASLVGEVAGLPNGNSVTFLDRQFFGQAGWFLATTINVVWNLESPPTALQASSTGASQSDSRVPSDPKNVQAAIVPIQNRGLTTDCQISVSATIPPESSFAGYQIYIWNFLRQGRMEEGPFFAVQNIGPGGVLSGVFTLEPDSPIPLNATGRVNVTNGSATVNASTVSPPSNWSAGWGANAAWITVIDNSDPGLFGPWTITTTTTSNIVALATGPVFTSSLIGQSVTVTDPAAGTFTTTVTALIDTTHIQLTLTPTFASSVATMTSANFFRYTSAQIATVTPSTTMTLSGAQIWRTTTEAQYEVWGKGYTGPDPHPVRLYFVSVSKAGTRRSDPQNAPYFEFPFGISPVLSPPLQPANFAASVTGTTVSLTFQQMITAANADQSISHFNLYKIRAGSYQSFNPSPTRPTAPYTTCKFDSSIPVGGSYLVTDRAFIIDPTSGSWDFNPTNVGAYDYWVTSVNINGQENLTGIPTTGVIFLQGNTGPEGDPTIYRDNMWNRLFNAQLRSEMAAAPGANVAFSTDHNTAYTLGAPAPATFVKDGQCTWAAWDFAKNKQTAGAGGTALLTGNVGTAAPDDFNCWEYLIAGLGVAPKFIYTTPGTDKQSNGEVLTDCGTGTTMGDYSVMWQQSRPSKFLDQENVVLSYYAKWDAAPGGSTFGFVRAQIGYWDNTTETVNGFDVPTSGSNMTTSYQRFYIITTLPVWTRNATTVCITKIGAIAQPNTTGKVRITMPMVNGGRLGAQWTSVMNPGDVNGGIIPGGTGGGGGFDPNQKPSNCVVGETLIYTPKGHVPIRDLRPGHEVYSVVGKRLVRNQIVQIHESQTATTRRITTPSGSLECTFRHPIGVKKANLSFQKASGFNVGEFLFAMNGHGLKTEEILLIEDLVQYDKYIPVYHLSLKKNPKNYITNGVVSHNRKPDP